MSLKKFISMIEKCNLSSFTAQKRNNLKSTNEIIELILNNKEKYPVLALLISDTSSFCGIYFNQILNLIRREKRLLEFQTPNRIKFVQEYTIANIELKSDFYYLFTPSGRLDWLTISIEDEKVSIADKGIVKTKILSIVEDEVNILKSFNTSSKKYESKEIISILYENLSGLPCFIEFNLTENVQKQQSLIISMEYFESIKIADSNNIFLPTKKFFSPLLEKEIVYQYSPLSKDCSSWLYLNSPKNFEILSKIIDANDIIETSKTKDPEIASYVIKGHENNVAFPFEITISVPKSLKIWFLTIYYLSMFYSIGTIMYVIDKLNLISKLNKFNFLCFVHNKISIIDKPTISNMSLAIIACIIATRGWLIIEENVLKNISIKFTSFMVFLIIMTLIINYI
jgi:hypothetical protein